MEKTSVSRETFSSRFGVLMAMAGSAVGLGNLWRFPYMVSEYGGAMFVITYLVFMLVLCLPILFSEFIIGRRSQKNAFGAFRVLGKKKAWGLAGLISVITPFIILCYYSVVGGWSIYYLGKSFTFSSNLSQDYLSQMFGSLVTSVELPILLHGAFILLTAVIVMAGVKKGIEKFGKIMMPLLFIMVTALAIYSMHLNGAAEGYRFMFIPDLSLFSTKTCVAALGQAFFSLSLGCGTMLTYASYVSKDEDIVKSSVGIAFSDFIFAILSSMAILPAVFVFNMADAQGPGLVFEALPFIFSHMKFGGVIAVIFFVTLLVAALTSSISLFEVVIAYLVEEKKMKRGIACVITSIIIFVLGAFCSLSFGPLSELKIFGNTIFEAFDKLSANILLILGSLLTVIFVSWVMKKEDVIDEFTNQGRLKNHKKFFPFIWFIIRYLAPIIVFIIFISNFC